MKENYARIIIHQSFTFLFIASLLIGCTNTEPSKKESTEQKTKVLPVQYKKPSSDFNDTLVINSISAVYYNPDSLQLEKIRGIMKKEEYETEVHNCFFLMRNARMVMKRYWPQVHIIEISRVRYLLFIKADKSKILIDLNTKNDMCGIFLFNRKKDPELVDMMNIDTALGFYFGK